MSSDSDAEKAKRAGWLGEVRPEDLETRELDDPYATAIMDPVDEVRILTQQVVHRQGSTQINTLLLIGVCLVVTSTFVQVFRAGSMTPATSAIASASASPGPRTTPKKSAKKPRAVPAVRAEPQGLPDIISAVASTKGERILVHVELSNSSDVPTEIAMVKLSMHPPGTKVLTLEGHCGNVPPGEMVMLDMPTPFRPEFEFSEEFGSFPLAGDVRVDFEVEISEAERP